MQNWLVSAALFCAVLGMSSGSLSGQTQDLATAGIPAENPISTDQLGVLLGIDHDVRKLSNGWLEVATSSANFFVQSNPNLPELSYRKAWPNSVELTVADINNLNRLINHGALHLDPNTDEVILEFTDLHLGHKPSAEGLLKSVRFFELMIDATVDMIAEM